MSLRYILILLLSFPVSSSIAQITGKYVYSAGVDAGSRTLTFKGSNFSDQSTGHVSDKYGQGSFSLKNNELYLNYHALNDRDSSAYKISAQNDPSNLTRLYVQIFDNKTPVNGALVAMRDKNFEILFSVTTLINGTAALTIRKLLDIHYITFDFIGFNSVTIPFDRLKNKANEIFVDFKPQKTMIMPKKTDVYKVLKSDSNTLILSDSNGTTLLFESTK